MALSSPDQTTAAASAPADPPLCDRCGDRMVEGTGVRIEDDHLCEACDAIPGVNGLRMIREAGGAESPFLRGFGPVGLGLAIATLVAASLVQARVMLGPAGLTALTVMLSRVLVPVSLLWIATAGLTMRRRRYAPWLWILVGPISAALIIVFGVPVALLEPVTIMVVGAIFGLFGLLGILDVPTRLALGLTVSDKWLLSHYQMAVANPRRRQLGALAFGSVLPFAAPLALVTLVLIVRELRAEPPDIWPRVNTNTQLMVPTAICLVGIALTPFWLDVFGVF